MSKRFREFVLVTKSFFAVRFVAAVVVTFVYILIAAAIQSIFVDFFGESTFNYIVGGLLSLFLGVLFCHYIGALCFMFVKGWHVACLPYIKDIKEKDLSAFDVGLTAFRKNLISFGAVYTVRALLTGVIASATDKLGKLLEGIPYAGMLLNVSKNGVVRYISSDILHYMFDATIFYIVKHPSKTVGSMPSIVFTAVKKYLCCLPKIMLSSVLTYIFFRFIPKVIKWLVIIFIFVTQGIIAGILISVLMYPIFYILDNALFDPLTMLMFLSVFSEKCDDVEDVSPEVEAVVDSILSEMDISSEESSEASTPPESSDVVAEGSNESANNVEEVTPEVEEVSPSHDSIIPTSDSDERLEMDRPPERGQGISESQLQALASLSSTLGDSLGELEMDDGGELLSLSSDSGDVGEEIEEIEESNFSGAGLGALLNHSGEGLDDDPLAGQYEDEISS